MTDTLKLDPFGYSLFFPTPNAIPNDFRTGDVGCFTHKDDSSLIIPIYVSDEVMMEVRQTKTICFRDRDDSEMSGVCLSNNFYGELQTYGYLRAALWHELGHFHSYFLPNVMQCVGEERKKQILEGSLNKAEYLADLFSRYYTSQADYSSTIKYMINQRKQGPESSAYVTHAIEELNMRLKAVRRIDNQKKLKKEILRLCNNN